MDTSTGRLVSPEKAEELRKMMEDFDKQFTQVPKSLERAAKKKLGKNDEAMVSLTSGGKLSNWSKRQRQLKRKNKQRIQKESRRKNR